MSNKYNDLRVIANDIILQLFDAKQKDQLEILKIYVDKSLESLNKKK